MYEIKITGLVQGVGFRPFIARLARELSLSGQVKNAAGDVILYLKADRAAISALTAQIRQRAPVGSFIADIRVRRLGTEEADALQVADEGFSIVMDQQSSGASGSFVPADIATCSVCEAELFDPANRRWEHPFISCSACGPRYSVIRTLPYERHNTAMTEFLLCSKCAGEYQNIDDRRHYAQTICCHDCGPTLIFEEFKCGYNKAGVQPQTAQRFRGKSAWMSAKTLLKNEGVLAIKDVGGFHLACLAKSAAATSLLRLVKQRDRKPLAVLFRDLAEAEKLTYLSEQEAAYLASSERPIVLVKNKFLEGIAEEVFGHSPYIGAMLPSNPLQMLLSEELGALVMTSANLSGDNLIIEEEEMRGFLQEASGRCDGRLAMLSHDRKIETPLDDPILRVTAGRRQTLRRGRGLTPLPLIGAVRGVFGDEEEIFAAGGDLKASFAYVARGNVYFSQHLGDLEQAESLARYARETERMETLFGFQPSRFCGDRHPAYFSANRLDSFQSKGDVIKVQHHKAHVASVVAEHGLTGRVLGFAFDGTGYGTDGGVWGSEVFLWEDASIRQEAALVRVAHLSAVKLLLNETSIKNPDMLLYGYMASMEQEAAAMVRTLLEARGTYDAARARIVQAAVSHGVGAAECTSMGRLFDAVSALLDVTHHVSYEGEAAIELEYLAAHCEKRLAVWEEGEASYLYRRNGSELDVRYCLGAAARLLAQGRAAADIALDFLLAVGRYVTELAQEYPDAAVVLSGGTFHNQILTEYVIGKLEAMGRKVYINEQIPCGDGGLALGQAYLAGENEVDRHGED